MTGDIAWRIDVLDPVGGLAFASHRQSDGQAKYLDATPPAVFIGAPSFQPIGVRSRSVGLAAARQCFQPGLFIEGVEVGFPELEDVIEFVRRCYQNGGGGAGGGAGGAGTTPPRPEGPGPELTPLPDLEFGRDGRATEGRSIMTSLQSNLKQFELGCAKLQSQPPGASFQADWSRPAGQSGTGPATFPEMRSTDGLDILVRGAARLCAEMIRRLPVATDNPDDLVTWQGAWTRLIVIVDRMGVGEFLHDRYNDQLAQLQIAALAKNPSSMFRNSFFRHWHQYPADMFHRLMWDEVYCWESIDALDDLRTWHSPTDTAQRSQSPPYQDRSLLNQLSIFLSSPPAYDRSRAVDADIELALFAAARIVLTSSRDIQAFTVFGGNSRIGRDKGVVHRRAVERLAEAAWEWLADQLPKRGFAPSLERAIASTSILAFA